MHDTFQGVIGTVSPAFGAYNMIVSIDIDRDPGVTGTDGYTGPGAAGVTGTGSLEPWRYDIGITGVFTNNRSDEEIYF
jgi:hypothetical protein